MSTLSRDVDSHEETGADPSHPIDNKTGWVAKQIAEYVESDGAKGSRMSGAPLLLLTTKGTKSGLWRRTALIFGEDDGRYLVVASQGGAPRHPSWYLNLTANPEVRLQVLERTFDATARTATDEEKPSLWAKMVEIWPHYAEYQKKTGRQIPVVILEPKL